MGGVLGIWLLCLLFPSVYHQVNGVPYDYGYTSECLEAPLTPQYGGGIVVNPEFNEGLKGWSNFGDAKVQSVAEVSDNKFAVVHNRINGSSESLSQKFTFQKGMLYTLSAWVRVSHGNSPVTVALRMSADNISLVGYGIAQSNCWSMLKSGFTANISGDGDIYFRSENTTTDILVDSISLQPFTEDEWKSHQIQSVERVRKNKVRFQAIDHNGRPLTGAEIYIQHLSNGYPIGNAMLSDILTNTAYQNWFTSRFKYTVFGNEMKWYSTERIRGREVYTAADAMLRLAQSHGIIVRGHNVFWDDPKFQPEWVKSLSPADLKIAADKRIESVMARYRGKVIHWDVVNENLHFNFLESKLGPSASANYYKWARKLDPQAIPFLNDYNTLEYQGDPASSPAKYLQKIKEIQAGGPGPLGIGLEGHFGTPDLAYVRSALDMLGSAKLPIWITELDVANGQNQANYLEQLMRELHAHPGVHGISLWGTWSAKFGCYKMCLTDNNFKNLPTGDVIDKLLGEWKPQNALIGTTDENGYLETSLHHGHYEATVNGHGNEITSSSNSSIPRIIFKVDFNLTTTQDVLITHRLL